MKFADSLRRNTASTSRRCLRIYTNVRRRWVTDLFRQRSEQRQRRKLTRALNLLHKRRNPPGRPRQLSRAISSEGEIRLRHLWYFTFVATVASAAAGGVAQAVGRRDLIPMFGGLAIAFCGGSFVIAVALSVRDFGVAWVVGLGWITKQSHPFTYWSVIGLPLVLGLVLLVAGVYVLVRAL